MAKSDIPKPLSLKRKEFIEALEKLINSGLDLYLVEPILTDALAVVKQSLELREIKELQAYQELLDNQKEE
jgi:hypothetical protein